MIVGLTWEETSAVDHPANEEEGWAVFKAVDMDGDGGDTRDEIETDEDLDKLVDEERAAIEKEQNALNEIAGLITDAPDEVSGAFEVVTKWLKATHASSTDVEDEVSLTSKGFLRQVYRMVQRAVKGPTPKTYSEKQISALLQTALPDLIKDLATIFNDKDADKKAKAARVKELLAVLREQVEAGLKSDSKSTD